MLNPILLGLGALSIGKDTLEKYVDEAVSKSKMTSEEGNTLVKNFEEEGKKAQEKLENTVVDIIKTRGQSLLPNYQKIQDLEARVAALEAKIAELQSK